MGRCWTWRATKTRRRRRRPPPRHPQAAPLTSPMVMKVGKKAWLKDWKSDEKPTSTPSTPVVPLQHTQPPPQSGSVLAAAPLPAPSPQIAGGGDQSQSASGVSTPHNGFRYPMKKKMWGTEFRPGTLAGLCACLLLLLFVAKGPFDPQSPD